MRKWHRWISLVSAFFLLMVGITGVILQIQQFFCEDEATREKLATMTSSYSLGNSLDGFLPQLTAAAATVRAKVGNEKLDAVELQLKGDHPTFVLHTAGAKPLRFVVNAQTSVIEK